MYPVVNVISLSIRLDLFGKLKFQLSTIVLSVGIKYYVYDLFCDINNYA